MEQGRLGTILSEGDLPHEDFGNPARTDVSWVTLFSADRTATEAMCAGIMTVRPDGSGLAPHRHAQAEIYHILSGAGLLTIEGIETSVTVGQSAFIPGYSEHAIRAVGGSPLRVFYVFATDRFSDVDYLFPHEGYD